ncbi:MAG: hypothetical protein IJA97_02340 [Clostridia bacterium]|nr:hypothetical protein [Clostridia bacterium]
MKKLLSLLLIVVSALCLFTACKKQPIVINERSTFVVINCQTDNENLSLASYMDGLDDIFVIENGMVVSINGIENPADWSYCWMLYTDDAEFSNTAWGTLEYEGKIYGSATVGAESLIIKNGCTYIWVYQEF